MRFIVMHKTNVHWESGAAPGPELIARVGTLLGELAKTRRLQHCPRALDDGRD
jgi:hypothetical protein